MKIVFIADAIDNQSAGVHFYTKNLIEALLKIETLLSEDKKNEYIFIHHKENPFFKNKTHFIIPSKLGFGRETYRRVFRIPKLIKKLKPDIVVEPCHIGPFNLPKEIKRVTIIQDITPVLFPEFHTKISSFIHKFLLGPVTKNADLLLAPSENTKRDIQKIYA
ncbi:MAG TPA: hypothetical protein PK398_03505, partial [Candidatus Gracilibacteria bacterium]|nr:hypothetical protein [Candidatus Gracilibacteria bacterium]